MICQSAKRIVSVQLKARGKEGKAYLGAGDDAHGGMRWVGQVCERADGGEALELALLLYAVVSLVIGTESTQYTNRVHGSDLLVMLDVPLQHLQNEVIVSARCKDSADVPLCQTLSRPWTRRQRQSAARRRRPV